MSTPQPVCYLVVPCYNEAAALPISTPRLIKKTKELIGAGTIDKNSRILLCDDGSADSTWEIIEGFCKQDPLVAGIKLAHNKGHQNVLYAGLIAARDRCDVSISLDADLQDDISVLDEFIKQYEDGCEIVFGIRNKRDTDTALKRDSAAMFYKMMKRMGAETINNHADYRLMSKRALDVLAQYKEENLFLRGIVTDIGFKTGFVYYDRKERVAGETKYPLKKMIGFAIDGMTSFSMKPLKIVSQIGGVLAILSIFGLIYALCSKISGSAVAGWTAIVASIWFLGGVQLLCLGVVGEYIGKIYSEVKERPRYIVEKSLF